MCPACLTTIALVVAGATSTSGLAALTVKKIRAQANTKSNNLATHTKRAQGGSSK